MWLRHKYANDNGSKRLDQFEHVLWYSVDMIVGGWQEYGRLANCVINDRKSKYRVDKHLKSMFAFLTYIF